jgi:hypothetical protein
MLHHGQGRQVLMARAAVMTTAYQAQPERFVRGAPSLVVLVEGSALIQAALGKAMGDGALH